MRAANRWRRETSAKQVERPEIPTQRAVLV